MYPDPPNNSNSAGSDSAHNFAGENSDITSSNTNGSNQTVLDDGTVVDTTVEIGDLLLEKIQDLADLTVQTKTIP